MANAPSIANTFTAGTKARATQVNTNFSDVQRDLSSGTSYLFTNLFLNNRVSNSNLTVGNNQCLLAGYHTIDTTTTYTLATSTARAVFFSVLVVNPGGVLDLTSGAEAICVD